MTAVLSVVSALTEAEASPPAAASTACEAHGSAVTFAEGELRAEPMRGSTNMTLLNGFGTYR